MYKFLCIVLIILCLSCKNTKPSETLYINEVENVQIDSSDFREFKVLDSRYINNSKLWEFFNKDLEDFTESSYNSLKSLILEQDISTLQKHIVSGNLSYEKLTKFYLYRIRKFDRLNPLSLNSVITLNPKVISQAKQKDKEFRNKKLKHPIFGMPILLKDNINAADMPTTAGAVVLYKNLTDDAFIVERLKSKGALILGKANLSEWAYFFCGDCPSGYSAIGGQTLNPYGRRTIDTGGSSSGSGVAVASNFCVAAIGSETSGSILSPSSKNSVVGLKPTIGILSRNGIVPISSTLDTPGPMSKNVMDNAILFDALLGFDDEDFKSINAKKDNGFYYYNFSNVGLEGKRFGVPKRLVNDTLFVEALAVLKQQGVKIIEFEGEKVSRPDFIRLLNLDMKKDLPIYLSSFANSSIQIRSIQDIINFNNEDSLMRAPYGQSLFKGIVSDNSTDEELDTIKSILKKNGRLFFDSPMKNLQLDGILSINNYHAGLAAVAEYPALTVPMGYDNNGVPKGLTFISNPLSEKQLLEWAYAYEQASKMRKKPKNYN
jgi:amidase